MLNVQKMIAARCKVVEADQALPDREQVIALPSQHAIFNNHPNDFKSKIDGGVFEEIQLALGCFWGAERKFWQTPGVVYTSVGYAGGHTQNPTYEDVCSGKTAHTEVVWVVFDPKQVSLGSLLKIFWESHDPTQGMRQGNDVGSQYRSAIYYYDNEAVDNNYTVEGERKNSIDVIEKSLSDYQSLLNDNNYNAITTEIKPAGTFYFAETYHQQYLHKNPNGYCGLGGTGITCPG